jgi:hypothetical protein
MRREQSEPQALKRRLSFNGLGHELIRALSFLCCYWTFSAVAIGLFQQPVEPLSC